MANNKVCVKFYLSITITRLKDNKYVLLLIVKRWTLTNFNTIIF